MYKKAIFIWGLFALGIAACTVTFAWDRLGPGSPGLGQLETLAGGLGLTFIALALVLVALRWSRLQLTLTAEWVPAILGLAFILTIIYYNYEGSFYRNFHSAHLTVITGGASSPYRYRVLTAFFIETSHYFLKLLGVAEGPAFNLTYFALSFAYLSAVLFTAYYFLRVYFKPIDALPGICLVTLSLAVTLARTREFIYSWFELSLMFFAVGVALRTHAFRWKRILLFAAIMCLATLNRETGISIALMLFLAFSRIDVRRAAILALALAAEGLLIYLLIRVWRGPALHQYSIWETFLINLGRLTSNPAHVIGTILATLLPMLIGFWRGLPSALRVQRRMLWIIPAYMLPILLLGSWQETRLLLPLLVPLLPISMMGLRESWSREIASLQEVDS